MSKNIRLWLGVIGLCGSVLARAQSDSPKSANPSAAPNGSGAVPSSLERTFFDLIRSGDALQFLSYVPEDGVNIGRDAQHLTRAEVEEQVTRRHGLYCKLFDSTCISRSSTPDPQGQTCSYRELLTQSEKVRTASTEAIRNSVRQAILVAEVRNQKCGGPVLIDFIFNHHQDGWKLFSIP